MSAHFQNQQELLVIDQAPLLNEAWEACRKAKDAVNQFKQQLHRFETGDLPSYGRWFHSTFGRFETEIRELSVRIRQKESSLSKLKEKHWVRFFGSAAPSFSESTLGRDSDEGDEDCEAHSYWGARGPKDATEDEEFEEEIGEDDYGPGHEEYRYADGSRYHDDEQDFHFDEDQDSRRRFEEMFRHEYRSGSGGYRGRRPERDSYEWRDDRRKRGFDPGSDLPRVEPVTLKLDTLKSRIKERYRALVRKLHPDLNPNLTDEERGLWNQVQAAYVERNLEQLDLLMALSDAFSGKGAHVSSLAQLRRVAIEIESLIAPLQRKVEELRKNRAWGFSERTDHSSLQRGIEAEFRKNVTLLRQRLSQVETQLSRFTAPAPHFNEGTEAHLQNGIPQSPRASLHERPWSRSRK